MKKDELAAFGRPIFLVIFFGLASNLVACSAGPDDVLGALVGSLVAETAPDVAARAEAISYASIKLTVDGRGGLMVMSRASDSLTYWQTAKRQTFVLNNGNLSHTAGLSRDVLSTRLVLGRLDALPWRVADERPVSYELVRTWQTGAGEVVQARGRAKLVCQSDLESVELPLITLDLRRCEESVTWPAGTTTDSTLWLGKDSGRIWAARVQPVPDGDVYEWQVARPWW